MARLAGLNHWMTSDNPLARELASIGNFAGLFPRQIDEALIFHAPMTGDSLFPIRGYRLPTIQRASEVVERSPIEGRVRDRSDDIARVEFERGQIRGVLGERTSDNICLNLNRAPDEALTGLVLSGEPTASLSRILDPSHLEGSGLACMTQNGYVFMLDNTDPSASQNAIVTVAGTTTGTWEHTLSVYARGKGSLGLNLEGSDPEYFTLTDQYQRFAMKQIPDIAARPLQLQLSAGGEVCFIGNQVELQPVVTSCMASGPAIPGHRNADLVTYDILDIYDDPIIHQTEGMLACEAMIPVDVDEAVSDQGTRNNFYMQNWAYIGFQGGNYQYNCKYAIDALGNPGFMSTWIGQLRGNQPFVLALLWDASIGHLVNGWKADGTWRWGTPRINYYEFWETFSGLWIRQDAVPTWQKNIRSWNINRGVAWIENFYRNVANA